MGSLMKICVFSQLWETGHGVLTLMAMETGHADIVGSLMLGEDACTRSALCLRHLTLGFGLSSHE